VEGTENRRGRKVALTLVLLLMLGAFGVATWSAFSSTTANTGNSFTAGTVTIADNDAAAAMFSMTGMTPSSTETACIKVSYTGTLTSNVRLYGTTTGTGLDPYINLTVTRGTYSSDPGFDSCTNFTADSTDYIGSGAGIMYSGTLTAYTDSYVAGTVDPTSGSPEAWTNGENHVYEFVVTVADNNSAQGLNATQTFTWEARNT